MTDVLTVTYEINDEKKMNEISTLKEKIKTDLFLM